MSPVDDARRGALAFAVPVVLAIGVASQLGESLGFLATSLVVYSLLVLSLVPILGGVGLLSLAQLTFAAFGALTVGTLSGRTPYLVSLLAAAVVAGVAGLAVGAMSARLRGVNFAVATLSLATAGAVVLSHASPPGFRSTDVIARPAWLDDTFGFLSLTICVLGLLAWAVWRLQGSRVGHRWAAVRSSERAAAALGIPVPLVKLEAAGLSAAIAGVGGGLMVAQYGFLTVDSVSPINGLILVAVAMVAGVDLVVGCVVGGALAVALPEVLQRLGLPGDTGTILFGVAAILTLKMSPTGISGQLTGLFRKPVAPTAPRAREETPESRPAPRVDGSREPALAVRGLTVSFGAVRALDGVDLVVPAGSVTGLIGANGAGKSTFVDAVTGFHPRPGGTVRVGDRDLGGMPAWRRARGGLRRTFQQGRAIPSLRIGDYLALCAGRGFDGVELLRLVDLFALPDPQTPIAATDVGTRRLVEVAGGLAARPRVLLVDEPTAGLGAAETALLARRVREIPEAFGVSVLLIEHDVEVIRGACDLVYVLDAGRVLASGPPDEVLARADVAAAYLGAQA